MLWNICKFPFDQEIDPLFPTSPGFIVVQKAQNKFPFNKGINAQFPKSLGISLTKEKEKLNSLSDKE